MSREAERKRLVKLLDEFYYSIEGITQEEIEGIADHLLENDAIVPPCKVGQTVYVIADDLFWEAEIKGWSYFVAECGVLQNTLYYEYKDEGIRGYFEVDEIGKTVFLSKAEAEYALKNRRSVSLVNGHIEE